MPNNHHFDKRADAIAAESAGGDDDLLTEVEVSDWLKVSRPWLQIGRHEGYGPPYLKLGHQVRYHRGAVKEWLLSRVRHSTLEYSRRRIAKAAETAAISPEPRSPTERRPVINRPFPRPAS